MQTGNSLKSNKPKKNKNFFAHAFSPFLPCPFFNSLLMYGANDFTEQIDHFERNSNWMQPLIAYFSKVMSSEVLCTFDLEIHEKRYEKMRQKKSRSGL